LRLPKPIVAGEAVHVDGFDAVVAGDRSREDLFRQCRALPALAEIPVERVGDCAAPRLIKSNIAAAHQLGLGL
jgi:hypothetical protein